MKIRNVREYALEIAATGQSVPPGEEVEVDADLARSLLEQPDNWQGGPDPSERPADSAAKKRWVAYAVALGMPEDEAAALTKDELVGRFPATVEGERPDGAEPGEIVGGFEPPAGDEVDLDLNDDPAVAGTTEEYDR